MPSIERETKTRDGCRGATKGYEGCSLRVYMDVKGKRTIGYGHLLPDHWLPLAITQSTADNLFHTDFQEAVDAALRTLRKHVSPDAAEELLRQWKDDAVTPRCYALIDMAFNLGGARLRRFTGMLRAWQDGDFLRARDEVLFVNPDAPLLPRGAGRVQTPYARTVGGRARDNGYRIAHNKEPVIEDRRKGGTT